MQKGKLPTSIWNLGIFTLSRVQNRFLYMKNFMDTAFPIILLHLFFFKYIVKWKEVQEVRFFIDLDTKIHRN